MRFPVPIPEIKAEASQHVVCHPAKVQNIECAVVIPKRSHYEDIIEIICKYHLRRTLGLKDADVVEVRIQID